MENSPFTNNQLQTLEIYTTITREYLTKLALAVASFQGEVSPKQQGKLSKAFDTLNEAAMYCNVALNHAAYAHNYVQEAINVTQSEASNSSADCGLAKGEGSVVLNEQGKVEL